MASPSHFPNCETAMASHPLNCRRYLVFTNLVFLSLLISLPLNTNSLSFNFPSFDVNNPGLVFQGEASISNSTLKLTQNQQNADTQQNQQNTDTQQNADQTKQNDDAKQNQQNADQTKQNADTQNQQNADSLNSTGRALYPTAIQLWDWDKNNPTTKRLIDFTTQFNFTIAPANSSCVGDGLTFLLIPENTDLPAEPYGGSLGLCSYSPTSCRFSNETTFVAVEFDTYKNLYDPSSEHIGIDVNSIKSAAYANVSVDLAKNKTGHAFVSYSSTTKNLSAILRLDESSDPYNVSYNIDLSTVLPQKVQVGFSAATGACVEVHQIYSWSFNSTLEDSVAPKSKGGLVAGIVVGIFLILIFGIAVVWFILRRKISREGDIEADQFDIDEDFDEDAGPKRFAYSELSQATNNFSLEGKLGEGGFGGVYKGLLTGPGSREIAVKKIKSGSAQGKKEYISEVKIISKLRHRNLVQLLGWCHGHGELLLVYEFMPNGSLDFHLFSRKLALLPWPTRYKIACGLASALLYLHEEWEQSVVHRDIKSSNVMLDLNFNPKLGDFGLARLADHDAGMQTTALAGTPGYMAPECLLTGKASKESDVYSFGIVALEIACGRRVIEVREEVSKVNLVEWVWDLYGRGLILEAVDNNLEGEFDEEQAKCLMVVGLWCAHPDVSYRPSMKQAIAAINFETPLPSLPTQLPVPIYVAPGMNASLFSSYTSSNMTENSSISTSTTISSQQSEKPLLGTK